MTDTKPASSALSAKPMSVRIGYGAAGIGNLYEAVPEAVADATLEEAYAAGIRYFDTAPLYGSGLSEIRVGRFLRQVPRDSFLLSTKVGRYFVPPYGEAFKGTGYFAPLPLKPVIDYGYDATFRSLEQSFARLGVSRIDILYIHDIDRRNQGEAFDLNYRTAVEGCYRALDELRRAGQVGAIGIGVNESEVASSFIRDADLDIVMLAGRYSLLDQEALADFLPEASKRNVDVVAVGVFNSGILAKGARPGAKFDYGDAPAEIIEQTLKLNAVCDAFGIPIQAAAVQFAFGHPAVKSVVLGMAKPERIRQNLAWFETPIPAAFWQRLKSDGLLAADVPTPA